MKYVLSILVFLALVIFISIRPSDFKDIKSIPRISPKSVNLPSTANTVIDVIDGVDIYYNGSISKNYGRHLTIDGYNLGLKWQCVEFVKRYYYQVFNHKMPDSYGHAKDFFDINLGTEKNVQRGMYQIANGNESPPKPKSIIVFNANDQNPYGHIGIIASVTKRYVIVAQQNWGKRTRMTLPLKIVNNKYYVEHKEVLGWLFL